MNKGEIVFGSFSGLGFVAALDAYVGTGTSSWLADICFSGNAPPSMIESMPMEENHSKHAAYFTSAGLTFLAAALGWEYAETQLAKLKQTEPQGVERKRILACIIYLATAADCANKHTIEIAFERITGFQLGDKEAKDAFDFLMRAKAPDLHRLFSGASQKERQKLLQATVLTWAAHGMDSKQSTAMAEHMVALLEFDQDDMCTALDRLWLKERANSGVKATYKAARSGLKVAYRATLSGAKTTSEFLTPHARRLTSRALVAIKR